MFNTDFDEMEKFERHKDEHKEHIENGESFWIKCSNCNAPLVQVWITRPDEKHLTNLRANCPHCGSKSFIHEIQSGFHLGHCKYTNMLDIITTAQTDNNNKIISTDVLVLTSKGETPWLQ